MITCEQCGRHHLTRERACPFCDARPNRRRPVLGMAMLSVLTPAILAACYGTPPDKDMWTDTGTASVDEPDLDADGHGSNEDCDDTDPAVHPDAAEICDGVDNDCDGSIDNDALDASTWYPDIDQDGYGDDDGGVSQCDAPAGYLESAGDCDDLNNTINPDSAEVCDDHVDNDCDGDTDRDDADCP